MKKVYEFQIGEVCHRAIVWLDKKTDILRITIEVAKEKKFLFFSWLWFSSEYEIHINLVPDGSRLFHVHREVICFGRVVSAKVIEVSKFDMQDEIHKLVDEYYSRVEGNNEFQQKVSSIFN